MNTSASTSAYWRAWLDISLQQRDWFENDIADILSKRERDCSIERLAELEIDLSMLIHNLGGLAAHW